MACHSRINSIAERAAEKVAFPITASSPRYNMHPPNTAYAHSQQPEEIELAKWVVVPSTDTTLVSCYMSFEVSP